MRIMQCLTRVLFIFSLGVVMFSCNKDGRTTEEIDTDNIQAYLTANNIVAQKDTSGLYYVIANPGTVSVTFQPWSLLKVTYTGKLTNGTVFDSTYVRKPTIPQTFTKFGALIKGWQYGLPKINAGGDIKLIVPSRLAYGRTGSSSLKISGNQILIYDIHLYEVITESE